MTDTAPADEGSSSTSSTPAVVFLPAMPRSGSLAEVQPALKPLEDQRLALPVYTSRDLLVQGCGPQQPWVAVAEGDLEWVFRECGAEVVIVDADLPDEVRWSDHTQVQSLEAWQHGTGHDTGPAREDSRHG